MTNAQFIIDAAVKEMLRVDGMEYPLSEAPWDEGEAEEWLRRLATGHVILGYNFDGSVASPVLFAV